MGTGQHSLLGVCFGHPSVPCQLRGRWRWEVRANVMGEIRASNVPVNEEVIEYMVILQDKFPQSM